MNPLSTAAPAIFGADPFWVAVAVFALTYLLVIADRIDRSIIALLGAGVMVVTGVLSQDEAIRGIDFNTIALLTGMMVLVAIARRCGVFEYLAVWAAQAGRAQPWAILAMLSLVTAILSAVLDNVTTVLLVVPVTLEIARYLEAPPYPFLFGEVFAANIGGTATLIGDPPNIIIGSAAHLSFNDFVVNLTPVVIPIMAVQLLAMHLIWGRKMRAGPASRARIMALDARELITDPPLMRRSVIVIAGVIAAFVLAEPLRLQPGTIALFGAAILMLLHNLEHHREPEKQRLRVAETFGEIDWITIFFFIGLFVIVHGIDVAGVLQLAAQHVIRLTGGDRSVAMVAILWGSALLTAIVDNIPFVTAMIPVMRDLAPHFGGPDQMQPLWWALSLGACLGGNGTLIGASANLAVAGIAARSGVAFGFATYAKHAFGLMLLSVAISNVYLWLRYL